MLYRHAIQSYACSYIALFAEMALLTAPPHLHSILNPEHFQHKAGVLMIQERNNNSHSFSWVRTNSPRIISRWELPDPQLYMVLLSQYITFPFNGSHIHYSFKHRINERI